MKQFISFDKLSPFRHPDWRLERVLQMTSQMPNPGRSTPRDDEYVIKLRNFMLRYKAYDAGGRQRLGYENPGLYWAYQIYDQQGSQRKRTEVEARLLTGQSHEEIAKELGTTVDVSRWYEALFFNVQDRLRSGGWIVDHVLMPAYEAAVMMGQDDPEETAAANRPSNADAANAVADAAGGNDTVSANNVANANANRNRNQNRNRNNPADSRNMMRFERAPLSEPFYDATLKMFGYFGGPIVLDYFLDCGFRRGAVAQGAKDLQEWFDAHWTTRIRHRSSMAAQTFEVNKYNVMELFQTHTRIMEIERSGGGAESKGSQITNNISAMLRNMPWAIGDKGRRQVAGTLVAKYDEGAAELRDSELMQLSSGRDPGTVKGVELLRLPAPRQVDNGQEKNNGDA